LSRCEERNENTIPYLNAFGNNNKRHDLLNEGDTENNLICEVLG
jgi:hypothetical protein